MIICAFENYPLNSKLLGDKDCLHCGQLKNMTPFPFIFPQLCYLQGSPNQAKWAKFSPYIG
jgi:hypothetical protein